MHDCAAASTVDDARAELSGLHRRICRPRFRTIRSCGGNVESKLIFSGRTLKDATVGNVARALWMLLASVGLVLLVACANVANLFLVRSEARQRDVAVRRALGAGRGAIARYFLTESVLLSIAGGAVGVALAAGAVRLLVRVGPATLPRLHEVRLDAASLVVHACGEPVGGVWRSARCHSGARRGWPHRCTRAGAATPRAAAVIAPVTC